MKAYSDYIDIIENDISDFLGGLKHIPSSLMDAVRYSCLNGGKRVRPILLFLSAEINDVDTDSVRPLAPALEFIHSYSLIHDDLPAMDNAELRRGMPATHKVFGEAMAILAGDALLNFAMEALTRAVCEKPYLAHAAKYLASKAGAEGMIGGQAMDISLYKENATGKVIEKMSMLKTASLMESALCMPCLIPDTKPNFAEFEKLGANIGLIFQITDDILDLGKEEDKPTLANHFGRQWCADKIASLEAECLEILDKYQEKSVFLKGFIHKLTNRSI
jgi:geranylgeranyl diphosphate synthase type II